MALRFKETMLTTFLIAMTPIGELRAAIPVGIADQGLSWWEAYLLAVAGNMVPVIILLWMLPPMSRWLTSFENPIGRLLIWRTNSLVERHTISVQRWGAWALVPFVAIPLPITGAWTGCLAAWALGIRRRSALGAIFIGLLLAGAVVSLVVQLSLDLPFINEG